MIRMMTLSATVRMHSKYHKEYELMVLEIGETLENKLSEVTVKLALLIEDIRSENKVNTFSQY
jgi:hypothetical protein